MTKLKNVLSPDSHVATCMDENNMTKGEPPFLVFAAHFVIRKFLNQLSNRSIKPLPMKISRNIFLTKGYQLFKVN